MKRMLWVLAAVAVVLVAVGAALPFILGIDRFRPMLAAQASQSLGRAVQVGALHLDILHGQVRADDLSVAEDAAYGKGTFVSAKSISLGVNLKPLIFDRKLEVRELTIDQPSITLVQSMDGDWNFASMGAKHAAPAAPPAGSTNAVPAFTLQLLKVTNARLKVTRAGGSMPPLDLDKVNIEIRDFSVERAFPFTMDALVGGTAMLHLEGTAGPIPAADASATPVEAKLAFNGIDLAHPAGQNGVPGMAGMVSIAGTAKWTGRAAHVAGRIRGEKLKLAHDGVPGKRPVEFDFVLDHDVRRHSGTLSKGAILLGAAPASLTGTYVERGADTHVHLTLSGTRMAIPELTAMLPPLGIQMPEGATLEGGTLTVKAVSDGALSKLSTVASLEVENTKLANFDLGSKMHGIDRMAGIQTSHDTVIQSLKMHAKVEPQGSLVEGFEVVVPGIGGLAGGGTVSPANALDFRMIATVKTSGVLMSALGQKGDSHVPFLIGGTTTKPEFTPDYRALAKQTVGEVKSRLSQELQDRLSQKDSGQSVGQTAKGLLRGLLGNK